jgi:6-phosphogluconolactonase
VPEGTVGQAQISISRTIDDLVRIAATGIVDAARASVAARGVFTIALSGGTTPRLLFEMLAEPELSAHAPWSDFQVFWGDERHVPPDHADSNYRMAREALLDRVPIPAPNIHRILAELPNAKTVALAYADELRHAFDLEDHPSPRSTLPRFDLILLGMGEDGHTASLFPHSPALHETERWVVANPVPKLDTVRITLTLPVINHARRIWFMITGGSKASVLQRVLDGPSQPEELPSQLINPTDGELLYLLDTTAAVDLGRSTPHEPEG